MAKITSLKFRVTLAIAAGGTVAAMQGSMTVTVNTTLVVEGPFQEYTSVTV